jgi:N-acetylglutamate synthase-like GNAT family acetyltransferase
MTTKDIPGGVRLNTLSGWNQTDADWSLFLVASPHGCFVMEDGAKMVGTVATLSYEDRFAWISMVLVDPEYRNRGIGTELLRRAIEHLDDAGMPTLKLDATPMGKPLYEKLGFVSEYEIERWNLCRTVAENRAATAEIPLAAQLTEILAYDRQIFGADRSNLLRSLAERGPALTLAVARGTQLQGYAFGRRGLFADHLGPWMAGDRDTAKIMLTDFLKRSSRDTVIVDALQSNKVAGEILPHNGFTIARPLTRMCRGPNAFPGEPESLCAILGPEFG